MIKALTTWSLVLGSLAVATPSFAGTISWNADQAIALGSGCNNRDMSRPMDTFFLANGDDVSVVFSGLGVNLPGGSGLPLSDRKNCSIRIPARIANGWYVGQLTQTLSYGVTKTAGSQGAISTRSTFFNVPASPFRISYNYGSSLNRPLETSRRVDNYLVYAPSLCRSPAGIFKSDLSISGQRRSDWEDLILVSDALDIRFEAVAGLVLCPR